ncbi:MAG: hypothetical protein ACFFDT_20070 [Candidatus Hodarchaeota archaeon]
MKKNLLEFSEGNPVILEKLSDGVVKIQVKWQHADRVNSNGRLYPRSVLEKEIARLKPLMKERRIMGASFHPKGPANPDDISHIWEDAWIEKDGGCFGTLKVIQTDRGKNVLEILKNGTLGLSSRGYGTTTRKKIGEIEVEEVNADFKLATPGDFVLSPSVEDATASLKEKVQRLEESLNKDIKETQEVNMTDQDKKAKIKQLWTEARVAGYRGTFEEWQKKILPLMTEIMTHRTELVKQIEERALARLKQNGKNRERILYNEAKLAGYRKSFKEWKEEVLPKLQMKEEKPEIKEMRQRAVSYGRSLGLTGQKLTEFVRSELKKLEE